MKKVLLWGIGDKFEYYWKLGIENIFKTQEIQILAMIDSKTTKVFKKFGYDIINKDFILQYDYDEILVTTDYENYMKICKDAEQLGYVQIDKIVWFQTYIDDKLKGITLSTAEKTGFSLCNKDKTQINIIGECNLRDAFSYQKDESNYLINSFIQHNSPLIMNQKKLSTLIGTALTHDDFPKQSHFCFDTWRFLDIEKKQFEFLSQKKGEWVVINLVEVIYTLTRLSLKKDPDLYTFVTRTQFSPVQEFAAHKFDKLNKEIISPHVFSDQEIKKAIEFYAEQLLIFFDERHIICVVNYPVKEYLGADWKINKFQWTNQEKDITLIKKCYHIFFNTMNCHILYMPENALGYELHKWGSDPQHYAPQFYDWLYESICVIVSETKKEKEVLYKLKNTYEQCFELMRQKFKNNEGGLLPLFV